MAKTAALVSSPDVLPVEAQEHLALAEDRRAFPANFALRLTLRGELERDRLARAVERALLRHPLLRATLLGDPAGPTAALAWKPGVPTADAVMRWEDEATDPPLVVAPFDLKAGPGLRLRVRPRFGGATLWVELHPAVCDPFAAARFVEELLCLYHDPEGEGRLLPSIEPAALLRRGLLGLTPGEQRSRLVGDAATAWRFFRGRSVELASPRPVSEPAQPFSSGSASATLAAGEVEELGNGARAIGATLHELLIRELAATARAWNERHPAQRADAPLRVSWLVDLRKLGDGAMPAVNMAGVLYHDFPGPSASEAAVASDDARLVPMLRLMTMRGDALVRASLARVLGRFPRGVSRLSRPPFLRGGFGAVHLVELSGPLAHARLPRDPEGRVRSDRLTLERFELLPSLHPGTPVGVGAVLYAGELTLSVHAGGPRFGEVEAGALLEALRQSLRGAMVGREAFAKLFEDRIARARQRRPEDSLWSLPLGKRSGPIR